MKVTDFFEKFKNVVSMRGIEKELDIPHDTIRKAANGQQKMAEKHETKIKEFLQNLKKEIGKIKIFNL